MPWKRPFGFPPKLLEAGVWKALNGRKIFVPNTQVPGRMWSNTSIQRRIGVVPMDKCKESVPMDLKWPTMIGVFLNSRNAKRRNGTIYKDKAKPWDVFW